MSLNKRSKYNKPEIKAKIFVRKIELLGGLMKESDKKVVESYLEVRVKSVTIKK